MREKTASTHHDPRQRPLHARHRPAAQGPGKAVSKRDERGLLAWACYDWANSAFPTLIQTFIFAAYFTRQIAPDETTGTAVWGNTLGLAGLVIAVLAPVLGAAADQGGRRKPWIGVFTFLCVATTAALWTVSPDDTGMAYAMVLVAIGTLGAELAMVFYNAMLADLAAPERTGRWSGWGWGLGYAGGLGCLVAALVFFIDGDTAWLGLDRAQAEHVRATFVLAAIWYGLFSLPLFLLTPDRASSGIGVRRSLGAAIGQLRRTLRHIRAYRALIRFLIARMLFVDGLATLFAFGGVYAAGTFDMDERQVLLFAIGLNVTAGLGAGLFALLDDRIGSRRTILAALTGLIAFGIAVLVATDRSTFWLLGLGLGIFVGPAQAASRSYLAKAAPAELRGELFGLLAFSGKATAFLGPLAVGWLTYLSGSQRIGMSFIVLLFMLGLALMWSVPEADRALSEGNPPGGR